MTIRINGDTLEVMEWDTPLEFKKLTWFELYVIIMSAAHNHEPLIRVDGIPEKVIRVAQLAEGQEREEPQLHLTEGDVIEVVPNPPGPTTAISCIPSQGLAAIDPLETTHTVRFTDGSINYVKTLQNIVKAGRQLTIAIKPLETLHGA